MIRALMRVMEVVKDKQARDDVGNWRASAPWFSRTSGMGCVSVAVCSVSGVPATLASVKESLHFGESL